MACARALAYARLWDKRSPRKALARRGLTSHIKQAVSQGRLPPWGERAASQQPR